MKIYVYLDESGSIHKNSNTKYFAVGGYFVKEKERIKVTSLYKRINKEIKDKRNIALDKELKSFNLKSSDKITLFKNIQDISTFRGCSKIFNKRAMKKEIIESNIFFNYAVKVLLNDCVIPYLNKNTDISFIVSVDNRNIRIGELNNLEKYLKTEFCLKNYDFKITYYDSSSNYGIQLADLIVNTFYNYYKDRTIVKDIFPYIKLKKFKVSVFPSIREKLHL